MRRSSRSTDIILSELGRQRKSPISSRKQTDLVLIQK
jgi:hypothetical protein